MTSTTVLTFVCGVAVGLCLAFILGPPAAPPRRAAPPLRQQLAQGRRTHGARPMTEQEKAIVKRHVGWAMAQLPPEARPALLRSTLRRVISHRRGIDRAAQQAVEGTK